MTQDETVDQNKPSVSHPNKHCVIIVDWFLRQSESYGS